MFWMQKEWKDILSKMHTSAWKKNVLSNQRAGHSDFRFALLLLSNLLVVSHFQCPVLSSQLHRGSHYDSFLPSFLHILQRGILLVCWE